MTQAEINTELNAIAEELQFLYQQEEEVQARLKAAPSIFVRSGFERTLRTIEAKIKAAEKEQAELMAEAATTESQLSIYANRYPNAPQDQISAAGWHLDYMFSDPANFWNDASAHFTQLNNTVGYGKAIEYTDQLRELMFSSIPWEHYAPMYDQLPLNMVHWIVTHIFPEHTEHNLWRWFYGPDNNPNLLMESWINETKRLTDIGDEQALNDYRGIILQQLEGITVNYPDNPKPLSLVSTKNQANFIKYVTPEVIDAIDAANIDSANAAQNAKTTMLFVGGVSAAVLLIALAGRKKGSPAPSIIKT